MTSLIKENRRRRATPFTPAPTPKRLFEAVCQVMDEKEEDVRGRCRKAHIVKTRAIYFFLGSELRFDYREIGEQADRDHSTVSHHTLNFKAYLDKSKPYFRPGLEEEIQAVRRRIQVRLNYC